MNLNRVFILGNLTADPELRSTPSGAQVANFRVATNRFWTDKSGAKQQDAEFHNVVVWNRTAEVVSQYLKKGSLVFVEGSLQTREWEDKNGQKRRTTEIRGERIQLGPRGQGGGIKVPAETSSKQDLPTVEIGEGGGEIKSEDLPF